MKKTVLWITALLLLMSEHSNYNRGLQLAPSDTDPEMSGQSVSQAVSSVSKEEEDEGQMKIQVQASEVIVVYELNNSSAAKELYEQLPLEVEVENFSTNEKVFYPPNELSTIDTPLADAQRGTLAYYAPWGDVVMFYDQFGKGNSLYQLGKAVSGKDDIEMLTGTIAVTAYRDS